MTVLAALWNYDGRAAGRACEAMLHAQAPGRHEPLCIGNALALGRAEYRPLPGDGAEGGAVEGASGALALVADARLDNRADLLAQLGLGGPDWATAPDSRLMIRCFEKWGAEAVELFVGDFALALWDRRSGSLLLARDFAGHRPLFFCETKEAVAAASTARGLHALDFVPRAVDEGRLMEVLAGLPQEGRRTFFRGIERVEPGESVTFRPGRRSSRIFWTPPSGEIRLGSPAEYAEALREKLDQVVAAQLRGAGGAVGTHLSAGLDSSAVTTSAALQSRGRILAFTSVPSGSVPSLPAARFGDEGPLAAETAAMYPNIEHRRISSGDRIPLEDLGRQLELYERSDLNLPNLLWADRINEAAAASGVTAMLIATTGNVTISYGGPEVLRDFLAEGDYRAFLAESLAARRAGLGGRDLIGVAVRHFLPSRLLGLLSRFRHRERHPAGAGALNLSAAGAAAIVARHELYSAGVEGGSADARRHMLSRVDPASYHKGVLKRWGIDLRDPTADRRLVEFCLQVPLRQYFRNGASRVPMRTALEGRVPESVRCNKRRGLQSADWFSLLSGARPEMKAILERIGECEAARAIVDVEGLRRRLDSWPADPDGHGSMAYRFGLLRGLCAGEFIRIHSQGHISGD